jgi:hypothetical protein
VHSYKKFNTMLHNVEKVDVPNDRGASDEEDQKETSSSKANALVPKAAATFGHGEATKRDITLNSKKRNAASLPAIAKLERKKPAVAAFNLHGMFHRSDRHEATNSRKTMSLCNYQIISSFFPS